MRSPIRPTCRTWRCGPLASWDGAVSSGRRWLGNPRHTPRIVAVQPRRIVVPSLHPGICARDGLDAGRARLAMRLVAREGAFEIVAVHLGQATSQDGRVLDKR